MSQLLQKSLGSLVFFLGYPPVIMTDQDSIVGMSHALGTTKLFMKQKHGEEHVFGCPRSFVLFPDEAEMLCLELCQYASLREWAATEEP